MLEGDAAAPSIAVDPAIKELDQAGALNGQSSASATSSPAPGSEALGASSSAAAPQQSRPATEQKPTFRPAAKTPTQEAPHGVRFDFNDGCRVLLPDAEHPWRVRITDLDTGNVLFETEIKGGKVASTKRYYVRFRVQVWQQGDSVFLHRYSAKDREVLIRFPVGTLGDTVGWFSYAAKFKERHGCRLTCSMAEKLIPLFRDAYPDITFVTDEQTEPERYYASYSMGLFFNDKNFNYQPSDFRHVGLHRTAAYILGVDPADAPPRIAIPDDTRPIPEPYVVIATQSTTQAKYWNNPNGWHDIVAFLKEAGYRVICIDQRRVYGAGLVWNHIPHGAEDETGDRPLGERARWTKHAEFFVGLSSGLAWLAWATGTPVVMISGFSHPTNEFATPYRVINYHACNSCWNDVRQRFDHKDFLWCPHHKNTPRQFECTRLITSEHVKATIRRIPGFGAHKAKGGLGGSEVRESV